MEEEGLTDRDVKAVSFMLQACDILELGSTHLGLTYTELKGIFREVCSPKDAAYETLKMWTRKLPGPATVEILKKSLAVHESTDKLKAGLAVHINLDRERIETILKNKAPLGMFCSVNVGAINTILQSREM